MKSSSLQKNDNREKNDTTEKSPLYNHQSII